MAKRKFIFKKFCRGIGKWILISTFLFFVFFATNGYDLQDLFVDAGKVLEYLDKI